jgi:hypothetical protein
MKNKFLLIVWIFSCLMMSCKKESTNTTITNQKVYNRYIIAGLKDTINDLVSKKDTTKALLSDFSFGDRELKDSIDLNGDKTYDLLLINDCGRDSVAQQGDPGVYYVFVNHTVDFLKAINKSFAIAGPFSYKDTINYKSTWTNQFQTAFCADYFGCQSMIWMNNDNNYQSYKFVGLRFINGNDTLYGWARIMPTIVVFDYAIIKK